MTGSSLALESIAVVVIGAVALDQWLRRRATGGGRRLDRQVVEQLIAAGVEGSGGDYRSVTRRCSRRRP